MATRRHTPRGRGFDQSLIYYEHKNDYWDQTLLQSKCQKYNPIVDLWGDDNAGHEGPARELNGTAYEEYMLRDRVLSIIAAHDAARRCCEPQPEARDAAHSRAKRRQVGLHLVPPQ